MSTGPASSRQSEVQTQSSAFGKVESESPAGVNATCSGGGQNRGFDTVELPAEEIGQRAGTNMDESDGRGVLAGDTAGRIELPG